MFKAIVQQFRAFRGFIGTDAAQWWLTAFLAVMLALLSAAMIWMISKPVDAILQRQYQQVTSALLQIAVLLVFVQLLHFVTTLNTNAIGLRYVGKLRNLMLSKVLDFTRHTRAPWEKGDLLTRISYDVDKVQDLVIELPMFLVSHIATFVIYLCLLFYINWQLSLASLLVIPLFIFQQIFFSPRKKRAAAGFLRENGHLLAQEEQILHSAQLVNTLQAEQTVLNWHKQKFAAALRWALRERWLESGFAASFTLLVFLSLLFIVGVAIEFIESGSMTVGQLSSFLIFLGYMIVPVRGFAHAAFAAQTSVAAAERLTDIQSAVDRPREQSAVDLTEGIVELRDVFFSYLGHPLFRGLNLTVSRGHMLAVVGPSGVGKTSLLKLIMGFLQADRGQVLIDGHDVSTLDHADVLRAVAIVWQQAHLFNQTVRENLLLAAPQSDDDALQTACEQAGAWSFISKLPQGLDSVVGELGIELSTGQKQRLAIAQAFLKRAPVLLLDEPSSALDSESEQALVQSLLAIRQHCAIIIVAHRLSSIKSADSVLFLNADGSGMQGSHEQLYQQHEMYRQAVDWQYARDKNGK